MNIISAQLVQAAPIYLSENSDSISLQNNSKNTDSENLEIIETSEVENYLLISSNISEVFYGTMDKAKITSSVGLFGS